MAVQGGEDVYASLLLTDTYLPGALVLAHSLRDAGTRKKLAILVTLDSISAEVVTQLKAVYDYVIPVVRIRNERPANLYLMNRPDLHSAFTKINLWRQTQFRKIVYLDADVVAYRAPDELFDLPHTFSAAPDIGWPDLFNTGVMVLTPNMGDYYAMMAMADRGISFDGADQGLLNMHFKNTFHRLSFTYNVTPSAHYQYVPAYKHFQSSINLVHFIGSEKPWLQGRDNSKGDSPFDEIAGRWWAVYDRHYRVYVGHTQSLQNKLVQYFVKGEYQPPRTRYAVPIGSSSISESKPSHGQLHPPLQTPSHADYQPQHHEQPRFDPTQPERQHQHQPRRHHEHHHSQSHGQHHAHHRPEHAQHHDHVSFSSSEGTHTEARAEQALEHQHRAPEPTPPEPESKPEPYQPPPVPSWDAQRQPPPSDSQPEAINFPQMHYEMSSDPTPFVPPERYPSPPKDMWYEVPKEPPAPPREKPRAIFPWESHQPRPSRVFHQPQEPSSPISETPAPSFGEPNATSEWPPQAEPSMTGSPTVEPKSEPQTPPAPIIRAAPPSDPWSSFPRTNAWDDVPEINRYVDAIQKHRRTRSQGLGRKVPELGLKESSWGRRGSRVTDFPSEDDRPSLPVTPAPIRRPRFWGGAPGIGLEDAEVDERLPAAEGVPIQSDWDPLAQLQKLANQQSEALLQKLGGSGALGDDVIGTEGREIPSRPLPFGSEDVKYPTYVKYSPPEVVSPRPVKPDSRNSPVVQNILDAALEVTPKPEATTSSSGIERPSYQGPGASFEKGEDYPTRETPMPPTEEELDALQA
ncbi:Glycogenin-1 [Podospora aff. communis PSN243]|uniref:glycogenin glucosyltransferase n=1 Tax=Podospora aff. communis PSN243 TaxID=3040156 RepID=A0AAV9GWB5_9PEZI|nr:Glycogenin-1 [Podospora aff. communis PSN243]